MKFAVLVFLCLVASSWSFHRLKLKKKVRNFGKNNLVNLAAAPHHALKEGLTNKDDLAYYVTINVGSGKQAMDVQIDTGSSDLWFPSSHCQFKKSGGTVFIPCDKPFNESGSTTLVKSNTSLHLGYLLGGMDGDKSRDSIQIANVTVHNQYFLLADKIQDEVYPLGILGLAKPRLAVVTPDTLLVSMVKQGLMEENKFGIHLKKSKHNDDEGGELILGGTDHSLIREPLHYFNVIGLYHWSFVMDKIEMAGEALCDGNCKVALDSGATDVIVPVATYAKIIKLFGAKELTLGPGNTIAYTCCQYHPDVIFKSGNSVFTLKSEDYVRYRKNNVPIKVEENTTLFLDVCVLGIDKSDEHLWILGDVFMNKFYTEFDVANNKVGIARAV